MRGGSVVRTGRRRAGLTQQELAERFGTTQSVIARLESGMVSPTVETLSRLARACDLALNLSLAPPDDHDLGLALMNERLTYEERLDQFMTGMKFAQELRDAGRAS